MASLLRKVTETGQDGDKFTIITPLLPSKKGRKCPITIRIIIRRGRKEEEEEEEKEEEERKMRKTFNYQNSC